MMKNLSAGDRVARLVVGAALAFLTSTPAINGWAAYVSLGIAAYLWVTALIGFCVIYKALDFNSKEQGGTYHAGEDPFDGRGGD
jgi:Inner membrane protein YgaP-like, transmembrane domain